MKKLYLSIVFLLLTGQIFPQGVPDALRLTEPGLGVSARALGMGNSFVGLSDDASAMYFNPAGLGLIKKLEISGGLDYYRFSNKATFFRNETDYSNSSTQLNQMSFVFPFPTMRGSLVFGLSYNNIKNFTGALKFDGFNPGNNSMIQTLEDTDYGFEDYSIPYWLYLSDDDGYVSAIKGKLNQSGEVIQSGSINNWVLSLATEVYPNLFIGGSLSIISGEYNYSRDYYEDDYQGIYSNVETAPGQAGSKAFQTFYMNSMINWELSGWDLKVGLLYQLKKLGRFGLSIQFPKDYTIKEKFDIDAYSVFGTSLGRVDLPSDIRNNNSDKVEYDIVTPFVLSGGGSINFKGLIASAEVSLIDYTQSEFKNPKGIAAQSIANMNKSIKNSLRATANFNLGLEYTIPTVGLRLRTGYILQPSPYKDDPSDFNKNYITGGAGFLIDETISVDIGYAHGWWKDYGDNYGYNVSRTLQKVSVDKILLSFSHRF